MTVDQLAFGMKCVNVGILLLVCIGPGAAADRLTKPVIADPHPLNTTVNYGETAMFQCKVRSDVQPRIQWLKRVDDRDARLNNATITVEGQRFIVLKTGKVIPRRDGSYLNKLTITSATEQHSGMYICLGANSMGYSFRSAFLNVMPNTTCASGPCQHGGVCSNIPPYSYNCTCPAPFYGRNCEIV